MRIWSNLSPWSCRALLPLSFGPRVVKICSWLLDICIYLGFTAIFNQRTFYFEARGCLRMLEKLWFTNQIQPVGSAGQCRLYNIHATLLLQDRFYLVSKSQFLKHSQAASGLKIKCPLIKNRCKPQVDTYVKESGTNFHHSRTKTQGEQGPTRSWR